MASAVDIRLACEGVSEEFAEDAMDLQVVTPGDIITRDTGFMRGHGTYLEGEELVASVAGCVGRVNKLITATPVKTRYNGEIGDVVIGRIIAVEQRRWLVETYSRLNSILHLSSVNLPGGELRRKNEEDERMMRDYLSEGDLISAEVQNCNHDGSLSLHTRSLKYGKLGQGILLQVSPALVMRRKTHFHTLPVGAALILGNNGYIWLAPPDAQAKTGGFQQSAEPVPQSVRETMCRLRNCIEALAAAWVMLYDTTILYAYEASLKHDAKDVLKPEVAQEIVTVVKHRLEQEL